MKIKELVKELKYEVLAGNEETEVTTLVCDSRKVEKGSVLYALAVALGMHMSLYRMWSKKVQLQLL